MKGRFSFKTFYLFLFLAILDLLGALAAFLLAYWFRIESGLIPYFAFEPLGNYLRLYLYAMPLLLFFFSQSHLYDHYEIFEGTGEFIQILKAGTFYILGVIIVSFAIKAPSPSRGWLLGTWALTVLVISLGRSLLRVVIKQIKKKSASLDQAIIIGANEEAKAIAEQLENTGMVDIIGFLDEFSSQGETVWKDRCILGPPTHYRDIAENENVNLIILVSEAISWETQREVLGNAFEKKDLEIQIAPGFSELYLTAMRVSFKGNVPLLRFRPGYITGLDAMQKIAMDYIFGGLLLILTAPLMLIFSLILWLQGERPIIKRFEVLGKDGCRFHTYKFGSGMDRPTAYRSFHNRDEKDTGITHMTPLGRFLFRTALDKLPQIFNVVMGKMSLVGPRTVPVDFVQNYRPWLSSILAVKPGMTGTWAFQRSSGLDHEISLTLYYIRNWGIWKDCFILFQTFLEIFRTRFRTRISESSAGGP